MFDWLTISCSLVRPIGVRIRILYFRVLSHDSKRSTVIKHVYVDGLTSTDEEKDREEILRIHLQTVVRTKDLDVCHHTRMVMSSVKSSLEMP